MKLKLVQQSVCSKCNKPGIVKAVEMLPDKGILMKAAHPDGIRHQWVVYRSISDLGKQEYIRNPKYITCPRCGKKGRIGWFRREGFKKPDRIAYYLIHEKMDGTWGKRGRMSKYRRCWIYNQEQREVITKKLGRFISSNP
jgi:hypothetical protein